MSLFVISLFLPKQFLYLYPCSSHSDGGSRVTLYGLHTDLQKEVFLQLLHLSVEANSNNNTNNNNNMQVLDKRSINYFSLTCCYRFITEPTALHSNNLAMPLALEN